MKRIQTSQSSAFIKAILVAALFSIGSIVVVACVAVNDNGACPTPWGDKQDHCELLTGNTYVTYYPDQGGTNTEYITLDGAKIAACTYWCNSGEDNVGYATQAVGTCP